MANLTSTKRVRKPTSWGMILSVNHQKNNLQLIEPRLNRKRTVMKNE